jgi:hypothetical protein
MSVNALDLNWDGSFGPGAGLLCGGNILTTLIAQNPPGPGENLCDWDTGFDIECSGVSAAAWDVFLRGVVACEIGHWRITWIIRVDQPPDDVALAGMHWHRPLDPPGLDCPPLGQYVFDFKDGDPRITVVNPGNCVLQ